MSTVFLEWRYGIGNPYRNHPSDEVVHNFPVSLLNRVGTMSYHFQIIVHNLAPDNYMFLFSHYACGNDVICHKIVSWKIKDLFF